MTELIKIREELLEFYRTNKTFDFSYRIKALKDLKLMLEENMAEILLALKKDLNKSAYEAYLTEVGMLYQEINYFIKHLKHLLKPKRVKGSISTFPASSYIYHDPYGLVLIMSPWNYPLQLSLIPLAAAIASGNVVILKMSEYSINTTILLNTLINKYLDRNLVRVVAGDAEVSSKLLDLKFDKIFFTGSTSVGKIVLEKAAHSLTPCDLELGGKSPVVVFKDANIDLAAKRILWGKLLNAGETCVAPDYVLIDEGILDKFILAIKKYLSLFLNDNFLNENYPKIINLKSYERLKNLMKGHNIIVGGNYSDEALKIEPTIILNPSLDSKLMTEEIFGPILPIIAFKDSDYPYSLIEARPKPLAMYLFSNNKKIINKFLKLPVGGVSINDTILHMTPLNLPFGGVGESGMGSYHGKYSLKAFTREKAVLRAKRYLDLPLRYQPFNKSLGLIKKIFK